MIAKEKSASLETAVQQIEKSYGKGAIMRLGGGARAAVEAIPTGALSLDLALGVGGLPIGMGCPPTGCQVDAMFIDDKPVGARKGLRGHASALPRLCGGR